MNVFQNPQIKIKKDFINMVASSRFRRWFFMSLSQLHGCLAQHKLDVELHAFHGSTAKRKST